MNDLSFYHTMYQVSTIGIAGLLFGAGLLTFPVFVILAIFQFAGFVTLLISMTQKENKGENDNERHQ